MKVKFNGPPKEAGKYIFLDVNKGYQILTVARNNHNTVMEELINYVVDALTPININDEYDTHLDETYSFEKIGGPFENMCPSVVLNEVDPIMYNQCLNDFVEGEGWIELEGNYYDKESIEIERENFIKEQEQAIRACHYSGQHEEAPIFEQKIKEAKKYTF